MDKEVLVYAKLIKKLFINGKKECIERLLRKLKREGRSYLLKKIILNLKKDLQEEKNLESGILYLAFSENVEIIKNYLEKILSKQIFIEKVEDNPSLILGGIFVGRKTIVDFSLKNFFKKIVI